MTPVVFVGLQIPIRLSPAVSKDDIGERDTANRTEPPHRIANRQQSVGMDVRRQAECGLCFFL